MAVNLSPVGGAAAQFFDNSGQVLTGGKIFTYAAGTTTPEATYTTNSGVTAHTNPIILDAAGRVPGGEIWLTANINYKFVLKDSNDVLIGTYDNISTFASDATLVTYTPASTGAVETTVARKLYQTISVFDFMTLAQQTDVTAGTMLLDVTTPIQNAINSLERGVLIFPPGYYKTTNTIDILNKNDQNDATQSDFQISAYGAKIVSTVSGSTPALYIHACKRLVIRGLELFAASTTLTVQVQGLWYSTIEDCTFGNIQFSGLGAVFDSHYLNRFQSCFFSTITLRTGTNADRSEFNGNIFDSCLIWFGEYGIKKYGDHGLEGLTFINCDISYQTVAILYVDEPTYGSMNFIGCYFDSVPGFPQDTKGIQLDFNGAIWNPNSANVSNFLVATASASQSKSNGGVRTGDRIPTSGYNLINNGDIRAGNAGFSLSNVGVAITSGTGVFGQYAKFTTSTAFGTVAFTAIPAPVAGVYTLTVIGRAITPGLSQNNCNGVFGVVQLASDWTIGSFSTFVNQGQTIGFAIVNGATGSFEYDIAYVGLTYGKSAPLYAPIHPTADFYSPGTQQGGFTNLAVNSLTFNTGVAQPGIKEQVYLKSYTASTSSTDILFINTANGFPVIEVDVYFSDFSFPDSVFLQKLYIVGRGSGTVVSTIAMTQQDLVQSFNTGGTQYLTWTTSVVSNQIMLSATASAATGGTGSLVMAVRGLGFTGAVVQ